jgi:hypothetical protein
MTEVEEKQVVELYAQGAIGRGEMFRRLGQESNFADALVLLARHDLSLPRYPDAQRTRGYQVLRSVLEHRPHV